MTVRIWLDDAGVADVLRHNTNLQQLEKEMMLERLGQIQASFLQNFGVAGKFEVKMVQTRPGQTHGRTTFRICAADARTAAILRKNPGWLGAFL